MEKDSFKTIEGPSEGIYREKGSKFIGLAFPVSSEKEITEIYEKVKRNYHDARHHCYAWRLGPDSTHFRANDDGEPSNSAGKPILGQIDAAELSNVLVIIVRYFGGTLLGVGGLIQAYRNAARDALNKAVVVDHYLYRIYRLDFNYEKMNVVMSVIKEMDLDQFGQVFEMECSLKVRLKHSQISKFQSHFQADKTIILTDLGEE